jgi:hypothetical protein
LQNSGEQELASNALAQGTMMEEQVLVRSALADCAKMAECDYWRGVCWRKVQQWKSAFFMKSALAEEVVMTEAPGLLGNKCNL